MMDQNQINFTPRAQKIVKDAKLEAFKLNKSTADLEHLFLAFLNIENSVINDIFEELEVEKEQLKEMVTDCLKKGRTKLKSFDSIKYTKNIKKALTDARKLAVKLKHSYVSCEHLFYSFLNIKDCPAIEFFEMLEIDSDKILNKLDEFFDIEDLRQEETRRSGKQEKIPALASFAVNCNLIALEKGYDPMIGREQEVEEMSEILCRRNKNNPILLGEAGVGKTALVEALAQRIVKREAPEFLLSKQIFSLDFVSCLLFL